MFLAETFDAMLIHEVTLQLDINAQPCTVTQQ